MTLLRKFWPQRKTFLSTACNTIANDRDVQAFSKDIQVSNDPKAFWVPIGLQITQKCVKRILVIGSFLVEDLVKKLDQNKSISGAFVLFNNIGRLPDDPPRPIIAYDVEIVQIPLLTLLADAHYAKLKYHRAEDYQLVFSQSIQRLSLALDAAMR